MIINFLKLKPSNTCAEIYSDWIYFSLRSNILGFTLYPIVIFLGLIFFDFFALKEPQHFISARLLLISLLFINLGLVWFSLKKVKNRKVQSITFNLSLLFTGTSIQVLYFVFCFLFKNSAFFSYFAGLLLITSFSTFLIHRYKGLQYIYFFTNIIIGSLTFLSFEYFEYKTIYIITVISSFYLSFFFRRDFIKSLQSRYLSLKALVPDRIARHMIIRNNAKIEEAFEGRDRFVVCLCSDWRDYQNIIEKFPAEYITKAFELFYDKVFEKLEKLAPSGQYFPNWTADELFIVFYSESKEYDENVVLEALNFAKALAGDIFLDVQYDFEIDLKYDIGLASGLGYLGVQGPKQLKKTTITSEAAGSSKRLESEAKNLRNKNPKNKNPILLMDQMLYISSLENRIFTSQEFKEITASEKNIKSKKFYKIQNSYIDVFNIIKKTA